MKRRGRGGGPGPHNPAKVDARQRPSDCAWGDVVVFADGRVALVAAFISGGAFGHWIVDGRQQSPLVGLPDEPIRLLVAR